MPGPGVLSTELSGYTQECCVTYNMLKLTRHVFQWTGDPRSADYYERALFNGVLGAQHPEDGSKLYYVPLQTGFWKLFGAPQHDYWCCTGTGSESFSKLGDSIYFRDDEGIFVNLFIASELSWRERGVRLVQETRFPEEGATSLTVRYQRGQRGSPCGSGSRTGQGKGSGAALNGRPLEGFAVAGRVLRGHPNLERRRPAAGHAAHAAARPPDAGQSRDAGGHVRTAGAGGAAGHGGADAGRAPGRTDQTTDGAGIPGATRCRVPRFASRRATCSRASSRFPGGRWSSVLPPPREAK